jgi:hypothetical protein
MARTAARFSSGSGGGGACNGRTVPGVGGRGLLLGGSYGRRDRGPASRRRPGCAHRGLGQSPHEVFGVAVPRQAGVPGVPQLEEPGADGEFPDGVDTAIRSSSAIPSGPASATISVMALISCSRVRMCFVSSVIGLSSQGVCDRCRSTFQDRSDGGFVRQPRHRVGKEPPIRPPVVKIVVALSQVRALCIGIFLIRDVRAPARRCRAARQTRHRFDLGSTAVIGASGSGYSAGRRPPVVSAQLRSAPIRRAVPVRLGATACSGRRPNDSAPGRSSSRRRRSAGR